MRKFASNGVVNSRKFALEGEFVARQLQGLTTRKSVIITLRKGGMSESRLKYELGKRGVAYRKLEGDSWLVSR